jgi:membrane protease YdiL (CAAX protease family)
MSSRELSSVSGVGLALALFGLPAVAFLFRNATADDFAANVAAQVGLVFVTAAVLFIVRFCEGRPLSAIGVRWPRPSSFAWAALLAAGYVFVATPIMRGVLSRVHAPGFEPTLRRIAVLPAWYRVVIVILGGTIEDVLYRGYAFERLSVYLRSTWGAAIVSALVFAYAHTPMWGLGVSTALVVPALLGSFFYLWRRDLAAYIMAHVATDLLGIVVFNS